MNTTTAPKARLAASIIASILASSSVPAAAPSQDINPTVRVAVIDDQTATGGEQQEHGLQALCVSDIEGLLNTVIQGRTPVSIAFQAVDEDASDNKTASLDFRPFEVIKPADVPSAGLPIDALAKAMKAYRERRAVWQQKLATYRKGLLADLERFIQGVAATQVEVSERFDALLAARNGKDFNRSDLLGCLENAGKALGAEGRRFIVFNSDGVDLPQKRQPRITALTAKEVDPAITIIFVNTSKKPETQPMFRGIANPILHADSVKAAMDLIGDTLTDGKNTATK